MVQALYIYDSVSFSWKYDIIYFDTIKYLLITPQLKVFSLLLNTLTLKPVTNIRLN
jgi:hypothetical protein